MDQMLQRVVHTNKLEDLWDDPAYKMPLIHYKFEKQLYDEEKSKIADRIECQTCEAVFKSEFNLKVHLKKYEDLKEHKKCVICSRKYLKNMEELVKHIYKCHLYGDYFKCKDCGKKFHNGSAFSKHKLIHNGKWPHKCEECGKGFAMRWQFQKHVLTHVDSDP